ncbi:MAG: shikimate kinase [Actinomycetota bacterium]
MGHIWLVGMMGSGKTTVGVLTAQNLKVPFVDTDATVMETTGQTIGELFAVGESVFREAEARAIAAVATRPDSVVATGGGAILSTENVSVMRGSGTIVLLDVDAETIATRVEVRADRPLLDSPDAIARVLTERLSLYEDAADYVVSTIGREPTRIAMEVAACVDM